MLTELENLLPHSGSSPETQWRIRILTRSASQAHIYLENRLSELDRSPSNSRAQVADRKLRRDFVRIQKHYHDVTTAYRRQQQAQISMLSAKPAQQQERTNERLQEEDFFSRSLQQRDIERARTSMWKVGAIYNDLASMVDKQQSPIDQLEDAAVYAKQNTEAGLEQIKQSHMGFFSCGQVEDVEDISSNRQRSVQQRSSRLSKSSPYRVEEDFHWGMPFETLGEDMKAVQKDVAVFGKKLFTNMDHCTTIPPSNSSTSSL